jgi:hypothetical protein
VGKASQKVNDGTTISKAKDVQKFVGKGEMGSGVSE